LKKSITKVLQHFFAGLFSVLVRIFFNPKVYGKIRNELVAIARREQCGIVVVSNHLNALDPFFIFALMPWKVRKTFIPFTILAKERFMNKWYKRWFMEAMGCVPVGDGKNGNGKSLRQVVRQLKAGEIVFIFPEGTVCDNGFGQDLGAVEFFAKFCPIILQPIRIHGIRRLSLDWRNILLGKRELSIYFSNFIFIRQGGKINAVEAIKAVSRNAHDWKP